VRVDVETIRSCVDELIGRDRLLDRVAELIPEPGETGPRDRNGRGQGGTKVIGSPAPWNDEAAGLVFTIHAGAREIEADLTQLLFSRRRLSRSGSDVHTRRALRNIPDLLAVATERFPGHWAGPYAARQLVSWPRACRLVLDEARWGEERWSSAPGGLRCPHCDRRLLLRPGWEHETDPPVWCRACPAELEGDEERFPSRSWPADAWIATLNEVLS
jgi:hypothetical protein